MWPITKWGDYNMAEKVAKVGVKKKSGYLYFVDKHGDISRAKMARGGSKKKKAKKKTTKKKAKKKTVKKKAKKKKTTKRRKRR